MHLGDQNADAKAARKLRIFDQYSQAACCQLCQEILNALPPVLCDEIYKHVIEIFGHETWHMEARKACEPIWGETGPYHSLRYVRAKYYWDKGYMSSSTLARMILVWYRTTDVHYGFRANDLKGFLGEEVLYVNSPRHMLVSILKGTLNDERKQEDADGSLWPKALTIRYRVHIGLEDPHHGGPKRFRLKVSKDLASCDGIRTFVVGVASGGL